MLCHLQLHPKGGTSTEQGPKTPQHSPARVSRVQHLTLLPTPISKTLVNRDLNS